VIQFFFKVFLFKNFDNKFGIGIYYYKVVCDKDGKATQ